MKWPASRLASAREKSFGMYQEAMKLAAGGADLIHLEVGRPFADTPAHIKAAAKRALDDGIVHYGDFRGNAAFREALAEKVRGFNRISVTADDILVTNGLTHAAFAVIMAAIDPGDEAILLEPYYPQHIGKIELAGGKVVTAKLAREDNFTIRREALEAALSSKSRMVVLINPANPTGRVYRREELEVLAEFAIANDLLVLSDEVYDHITYDGAEHVSIASLPGMRERTLSCFAFTKAYSMDGWRVGYIAADRSLMPALAAVTMNDVTHVNVFVQEGARAAVSGPQDCLAEMHAADARKRGIVVERLNQMPGVSCRLPEGTIYAFPDITGTGRGSDELARALLHETGVVVESGSFYGAAGEGHLRVCFGSESEARLVEAMDRIQAFLNR